MWVSCLLRFVDIFQSVILVFGMISRKLPSLDTKQHVHNLAHINCRYLCQNLSLHAIYLSLLSVLSSQNIIIQLCSMELYNCGHITIHWGCKKVGKMMWAFYDLLKIDDDSIFFCRLEKRENSFSILVITSNTKKQ